MCPWAGARRCSSGMPAAAVVPRDHPWAGGLRADGLGRRQRLVPLTGRRGGQDAWPACQKEERRENTCHFPSPGSIIHKTTRPCAATLHPEVSHVECNAERGRWLEPPPRAQNGGRPGRRCNLIAQPASRTKRRPRNRPAACAARQAAGVDHPNRHLSGHVLAPDSRSPPGRHEGLRIRVRASLLAWRAGLSGGSRPRDHDRFRCRAPST